MTDLFNHQVRFTLEIDMDRQTELARCALDQWRLRKCRLGGQSLPANPFSTMGGGDADADANFQIRYGLSAMPCDLYADSIIDVTSRPKLA
jgi:hypothetical protein